MMFTDIFKLRPKKILGIDIGTSSIRIVELGRKGKIYRLDNYGEVELLLVQEKPFQVFEKDTLLLSNKKIATTIQAICQEAGIQAKDVNFSIPDFCSFFTSLQLPTMRKEEIPEAVSYEVRPYIPIPLSEITLDWTIIEGEVAKTPLKVLVVAIPNDVISQYQEIAHLSGLNLKILESEVFPLVRSLIKNKGEKKRVGLIDIGARSTTCSIFDQGVLKISHSFNIAGNELTETIIRALSIDYNRAEELKKTCGLLDSGEVIGKKFSGNIEPEDIQLAISKKREVRKILLPLVDAIIAEVKKIFRDFYKNEGKEIEKIILAGSSALIPGLKDYISSELKKEVIIGDPFFNISFPPILSKTLKVIGPSYAIAVGLALKGFE